MVRNLPLPFKKAFDNSDKLKRMAAKMIDEHKTARVPGEPKNFVDCYLDEISKVCRILRCG